MLENLSRYENLGTPKYFCELLERLKGSGVTWTTTDVRKYFHNRIIDGRAVFDGCVPLAAIVGLVNIGANDVVTPAPVFIEQPFDETRVSSWILDRLLKNFKSDESFLTIMCSENVSYDVIYRLIQIDKSAFAFEHASFRQLLLTLGFLQNHPDEQIKKYIVSSKYRRLFDAQLLPEIRKRKLGIEGLEEMLERKRLDGLRAEEFVLAYEKQRLYGHPDIENIERISDYDTGAGYDVISFNHLTSAKPDRFIEVKSYEETERFHWSANEISVSRIRRSKYFLYLVDRKKMDRSDYTPTIISDPFENVFKNEVYWSKEATSWRFSRAKPE